MGRIEWRLRVRIDCLLGLRIDCLLRLRIDCLLSMRIRIHHRSILIRMILMLGLIHHILGVQKLGVLLYVREMERSRVEIAIAQMVG